MAKNDAKNTAILALVVNIFIAGLGTIIAGRKKEGIYQLVLYLVGVIMARTIFGIIVFGWIGYVLMLVAWVWALMTSIQLIQES